MSCFILYIDDLLTKLSESDVGCCMGFGALACRRQSLSLLLYRLPLCVISYSRLCDGYWAYDIIFNAQKSKFIVFVSPNRRFFIKAINSRVFILVPPPPSLSRVCVPASFTSAEACLHDDAGQCAAPWEKVAWLPSL